MTRKNLFGDVIRTLESARPRKTASGGEPPPLTVSPPPRLRRPFSRSGSVIGSGIPSDIGAGPGSSPGSGPPGSGSVWATSRERLVPVGSPGTVPAREDTLEWALRPALLVGQLVGIFSCSGGPNPRFRWLSPRALYFVVSAAAFIAMSVLLLLSPEDDLSTSVKFVNGLKGNIIHTSSTLAVLFLFLRLSRRWHRVSGCFQRVERRLATEGFGAVYFGSKVRTVTAVLISATIVVEMAIDAMPVVAKMLESPESYGVGDFVETFYYESFPQMRLLPVYNIAIVVWVFWTKAQAKLAITYTDLILWAIGAAVAAKFRSINKRIGELKYEAMSEMDWRRIRESYNDVVIMITDLDRILGPHILLSYAIGLWFVCGGILLLLDSEIDNLKRVYVFLSMTFWIGRVIFSTLSLASVYEENISIRNSLHLVPTHAYGDEVHRFAMQACHDDLGFTGMKFFTVTRSVLLTLAGTIASYEIVLMEFNR